MKKRVDIFQKIGLAILVVYLIVDRFVVDIPNYIAFPCLGIAILLLLSIVWRKKSCASSFDEDQQ